MSTMTLVLGAPWARWLERASAAWQAWRTPRPLSRGEEAEQVRAYARSVRRTDPGFAEDLFAAAARHEGGN